MANVYRTPGKVFRISLLAGEDVATYILGDASDGIVSTISVCIAPQAGFGGSISVKGRPRNPEAAQPRTPPMPALPVPFVAIPYLTLNIANAVTSPPAYASAPIIGEALILIPATGLQIALDVTAVTAGEAWVYWTPCEGAAA